MVTFVKGNIFSSPAQVLTNTVNTVGVMGKGLALEFKTRQPEMYNDYRTRCAKGVVLPGQPYLWENDRVQVLNFPTKRDWREPSRIEDIDAGLRYLANHYQEMGIHTLAMPPLGCGLGGLKWELVRPLIEQYLGPIADLEVFIYEPASADEKGQSSEDKSSTKRSSPSGLAARPDQFP